MNPVFRWMLRKLQRTCKHELNHNARLKDDIFNHYPRTVYTRCEICGAISVKFWEQGREKYSLGKWIAPWL